jgi:hypothetical protein
MLSALLNERERFEKADWHVLFRGEVPPVFWSVFRDFVIGHDEIQSSLAFLAEMLVNNRTVEHLFDIDSMSSKWLQEVTAL